MNRMLTVFCLAFAGMAAPAGELPFYPDKLKLLEYADGDGRHPVATVADWNIRRAHVLAGMEAVMGKLPDRPPVELDVAVVAEVEFPTYTRKQITFAAEAGDRLSAYLCIPRDLDGKTAGILALHQTYAKGKDEVVGRNGSNNLRYGHELAERGYVVIAPDYPRFGGYDIDPYVLGYESATMKGIWNHMRAVDLLQSLPEVDPERIGAIGHSLGGHNTLFVGAFDPRIKVMVTSCGFTYFPKYYGGDLRGWSHPGYMPRIAADYGADPARMPFDFTEILGLLAPRAVFINAPLGDDNFEYTGVEDCVAAARPVFELFSAEHRLSAVYPDAAHDFPPAQRSAAYAVMAEVLGK